MSSEKAGNTESPPTSKRRFGWREDSTPEIDSSFRGAFQGVSEEELAARRQRLQDESPEKRAERFRRIKAAIEKT